MKIVHGFHCVASLIFLNLIIQSCAVDDDLWIDEPHRPPSIQTDFALTHSIPEMGDRHVDQNDVDPTKIHLRFNKAINYDHFIASFQIFEQEIGAQERKLVFDPNNPSKNDMLKPQLSNDGKEISINLLGTQLLARAKYTLTINQSLTSVEAPFENIPKPVKLEFATGGGFDDDNLDNIDPDSPPYLTQARYYKVCNPQGSETLETGVIEMRFNENIQSGDLALDLVNKSGDKVKGRGVLSPVVYNDGSRDLKTWVMGAPVNAFVWDHWIKIDPELFIDFSGESFVGQTHLKLSIENPLACLVSIEGNQ